MRSSSEEVANQLKRSFATSYVKERYCRAEKILRDLECHNDLIEEALLRCLSGHQTVVSSLDGDGCFLKFWESRDWSIDIQPLWVSSGVYSCGRSYGSAVVINNGIFSCLWKLIQQHVTSCGSKRALELFFAHSLHSISSIGNNSRAGVGNEDLVVYSYGDDFAYGDVSSIQEAFLDTLLPLSSLLKENQLGHVSTIRTLFFCMTSVKCLAPTGYKALGKSCAYHTKDRQICAFVLATKFYLQNEEEATVLLSPLMMFKTVLGPFTLAVLDIKKEEIALRQDGTLVCSSNGSVDISCGENISSVGNDDEGRDNKDLIRNKCVICLDDEDGLAKDDKECNISRDIDRNIKDKKDKNVIEPLVRLNCSHIFHLYCIKKWASKCGPKSCPICREKLGHFENGEFYFTSISCYLD